MGLMGAAGIGFTFAIIIVPKKEGCFNYSMVLLELCLVLADRAAYDNYGVRASGLCAGYIHINRIDHTGAIINRETVFAREVQSNFRPVKTGVHA